MCQPGPRARSFLALLAAAFLASAAAGQAKPDRKPDVRYVPTPPEVMDKMLEVARITSKDVVYDLGCGDGRIVCAAARRYGCKAAGYDIDPDRIKDSEANKAKEPAAVRKLISFHKADIFKLDLSGATCLVFQHGSSGRVNVIYRRADGNVGWVDPPAVTP